MKSIKWLWIYSNSIPGFHSKIREVGWGDLHMAIQLSCQEIQKIQMQTQCKIIQKLKGMTHHVALIITSSSTSVMNKLPS